MNKYFAYLHISGLVVLKRYSQASYDDALDSDFVKDISNIIEAANRKEAEQRAREWAAWAMGNTQSSLRNRSIRGGRVMKPTPGLIYKDGQWYIQCGSTLVPIRYLDKDGQPITL